MPSHVSREEDGWKSWYTDYVKVILSWRPPWRRNLAVQKSFQNAIASSLLPPASAPTPTPTLSPSSPPTSAFEGATPPSYSPAPSPHPASATSPASGGPPPVDSPYPFDFTYTDDSPSSSSNFHKIPHSHSPPLHQTSHKHNHHTTNDTIIAPTVILTAIGTFLFIALILCCYNRHRRKNIDSRDAQKDGRPLLNLSFSDFSVGSSLGGNSVSKDKFEDSSVNKISQDQSGCASSLEIKLISIESDNTKSLLNEQTSTALGNNTTHASLPLPPGMVRPPIRAGPPVPGPPPPPPPIPAGTKLSGPQPPPPLPPKGAAPPRPPPPTSMAPKVSRPIPLAPGHLRPSGQHVGAKAEDEAPKTKLKPFFWDKVLADPDHSMVWHEISSGSFQFNEEMIESLFGYSAVNKPKSDRKKESTSNDPLSQHIQILDPKKSQNLSILLRASNVTMEEVGDALLEGNELPIEILRTLLKMAPTSEEELKLRLFSGELSQLGPAERFLKGVVDIPFAYKRMEALLFMGYLQEEVPSIKKSFATLEVACKELRSSRLFLKLLEAVLKTGNRMNDGTYRGGAQAFKLDTLLKLADVKGTDGKTTLLHFVVQEIIRSEGIRAARANRQSMSMSSINPADVSDESPHNTEDTHRALGLQVVSGLGVELENVKKAAALDADTLTNTVASFGHGLLKVKEFLNSEMKSVDEEDKFKSVLTCFAENAEIEITRLLEEEKRIRSLVKTTTDYFHGNTGKDEGLHLFVTVRDFLAMVDKACREVKAVPKKVRTTSVNKEASVPLVVDSQRQLLFPAIKDRRMDSSSSDDERE